MTNEKRARLWLSLGELSSGKIQAILNEYGNAWDFYQSFTSAMERVLGAKAYQLLDQMKARYRLDDLCEDIEKRGIQLVIPDDEEYPESFHHLNDPPIILYVQGSLPKQQQRCISIVGARRASRYGKEMAFTIGRDLARAGVSVISGFARGIDSSAQDGCMAGGAPTVAIMGRGLDEVYPPENLELLAQLLAKGGCAISEFPLGSAPYAAHFPQRNRLVSAMGQGILLVEGKINGGGMITIRHGLDLGREIFALPGQANHEGAQAPHILIREGARLITSAKDILEDMGWDEPEEDGNEEIIDLSKEEQALVALMKKEAMSFEELQEATEFLPNALNSHLTILELKGIIRKCPGRIYDIV